MKKLRIFSIIAGLFICVMSISPLQGKAQVQVSFQVFYDELSPYGSWVDYPGYGYAWHPARSTGFRPYSSNGHWAWSDDYEWIWVSDYDWGWGPFHYGRWFYDSYYGWLWIPGYDWSPAWVAWRSGGDYYGWAPLSPGINFSISFSNYSPPQDYWCFVDRRYIVSPNLYQHCYNPRYNTNIIQRTAIVNNYNAHGGPQRNVYVGGPQRQEAERYAGTPIKPVKVQERSRPGRTVVQNNNVEVYRPRIKEDKDATRPKKIAPAKPGTVRSDESINPVKTPAQNRVQPVPDRPVKTPRVNDQNPPVRTPPIKQQPERKPPVMDQNPPVRVQPVPDRPIKTPRVNDQNQPVRTPPIKQQPERKPPIMDQNPPVRVQPVPDRPIKTPPVNNPPPVRTQPIKEQPVRTPPVNNPPPVRVQPVNPPPANNPPKKDDQRPGKKRDG